MKSISKMNDGESGTGMKEQVEEVVRPIRESIQEYE